MIGALRQWLTSIVVVTLLIYVMQTLVPSGTLRKVSGFIGGMVLLCALIQPILKTDLAALELDLSDYSLAIEQRQAELEEAENQELSRIIAERTQAYIWDKADALGLSLQVRVRTQITEEGIPVPAEVELKGPESQELSQWLEQELGLPPERQVWYGSEN